jgi:hypothetical protein
LTAARQEVGARSIVSSRVVSCCRRLRIQFTIKQITRSPRHLPGLTPDPTPPLYPHFTHIHYLPPFDAENLTPCDGGVENQTGENALQRADCLFESHVFIWTWEGVPARVRLRAVSWQFDGSCTKSSGLRTNFLCCCLLLFFVVSVWLAGRLTPG